MTPRYLPLALILAACSAAPSAGPEAVGHAVVFELTDPTRVADLDRDLEAVMRPTPGVLESHVGPRADVAVREGVTDTSFDLLLWVCFQDAAAMHSYLESPAHVAVVEQYGPSIRSVRVFDFWAGR